jgi:hypothetical protein
VAVESASFLGYPFQCILGQVFTLIRNPALARYLFFRSPFLIGGKNRTGFHVARLRTTPLSGRLGEASPPSLRTGLIEQQG